MNKFFPALSLYELLRIIIPGAYLLLIILDSSNVYSTKLLLFDSESHQIIYNLIIMFLLGLLVYSFDFPKMLNFFQTDLPSRKISKKHPDFDKERVTNSYFIFYNELASEEKLKTEKYSGFFHLAVNMSVISFLFSIISIINGCFAYKSDFQTSNYFLFIISLVIAVNIYKKRLRGAFQRHLEAYYKSDKYKEL